MAIITEMVIFPEGGWSKAEWLYWLETRKMVWRDGEGWSDGEESVMMAYFITGDGKNRYVM